MQKFDYIGLYGAILSTFIVLTHVGIFGYSFYHKKIEKNKFKTDLYYLTKIDNKTKKKHPIIVILLANLGRERISIKAIEYSGISNGLKTSGSPGWYEQPEEVYGIRNRLLPVILETGQTKDLPMLPVSIFEKIDNLKIKLIDFNDKEYFIEQRDINKIKKKITRFKKEGDIIKLLN